MALALVLLHAILVHDFGIKYVAQYTDTDLPTLYLLAANSTPDTLRDEFVRRVEAGQPPMTHSELKAEIESHRPEPASTGNKSAPKAAAPSLRQEILACLDQAASLLNGKNAAALKALESARNLVVSLND